MLSSKSDQLRSAFYCSSLRGAIKRSIERQLTLGSTLGFKIMRICDFILFFGLVSLPLLIMRSVDGAIISVTILLTVLALDWYDFDEGIVTGIYCALLVSSKLRKEYNHTLLVTHDFLFGHGPCPERETLRLIFEHGKHSFLLSNSATSEKLRGVFDDASRFDSEYLKWVLPTPQGSLIRRSEFLGDFHDKFDTIDHYEDREVIIPERTDTVMDGPAWEFDRSGPRPVEVLIPEHTEIQRCFIDTNWIPKKGKKRQIRESIRYMKTNGYLAALSHLPESFWRDLKKWNL